MRKRIPYSFEPRDLFSPGLADDFFHPDYGPVPSDEALCAEISRLAYVRHEDAGGRERLVTILRDRAKFDLNACFNASGSQGFAASGANPQGNRVTVIAFRGTEPNEGSDLGFDLRAWPLTLPGGGRVHRGFFDAFAAVQRDALAAIQNASGRLLITGHSLGAAMATICAAVAPVEKRAGMLLCTFGSPRIGDDAFAASLAGVTHLRHAGAIDVVSRVPPVLPVLRYHHHGIFRCIDRDGAVHEFHRDEAADRQADPLRAQSRASQSFGDITRRLIARLVPLRQLADHAPINYMSAVWGIRA